MKSFYEITIGGSERVVTVTEAASRELTISGKSYVVPQGVVAFIEELAEEVREQQERKTATDKQIEDRISQRIDRMLKALDQKNMLSKHLDDQYPLPANVETSSGEWTFLDEARSVCRDGLKNNRGDELADDIGSRFGR